MSEEFSHEFMCLEIFGNLNNRAKCYFFNLSKIDNCNKWKNYVIVTRVKLSVELDILVMVPG